MANKDAPDRSTGWTNTQAYVMALICLLLGLAVGHLLRGSAGSQAQPAAVTGAAPTEGMPGGQNTGGGVGQQITPEQLKVMADTQAAPLIERLKSEPKNARLLAEIGNLYYDAQQYRLAVAYYQRSLQIQPGNTNVRTDLGTAMWYLGDPDRAIDEFNTVLKAEPTKVNALMNLGVVEWQGKMNVPAAIAAWEKLLATNPNFEGRQKVEQLIRQAKIHSNLKSGAKSNNPPM